MCAVEKEIWGMDYEEGDTDQIGTGCAPKATFIVFA